MPKFDAGSVVDPLDYDFTTVNGYKHRRAKGTIPEPTDEMITTFISDLRDLMKEAGSVVGDVAGLDLANPAEFFQQLDNYDPAKLLDIYKGMAAACSKLCSGQPSAEEIAALPIRIRVRFFQWLQQEVVSPEAVTGAGNAVVTPLRSAVAG